MTMCVGRNSSEDLRTMWQNGLRAYLFNIHIRLCLYIADDFCLAAEGCKPCYYQLLRDDVEWERC